MAIKVNGTTVINDSRALTNIASVDATTVAAIGAAGVGGATSLLVGPTNVSSVASLTISLPTGYADHIIKFRGMKRPIATLEFFQAQLGNASGTIQTGSYYASSYVWKGGGGGTQNATKMRFGEYYSGGSWGDGMDGTLRIHDAELTTVSTYIGFEAFGLSGPFGDAAVSGCTSTSSRERNATIKFTYESNGAFSGQYEVWGVNPS